MKLETLLRETLRDWSTEAVVPHDLADRALRGRSRFRPNFIASAAVVTAAVVAASVLVPRVLPTIGQDDGPAAAVATGSPKSSSEATTRPVAAPTPVSPDALPRSLAIHADTEGSRPKKLIAAGRVVVSAYKVWEQEKIGDKSDRRHDTWFLYNSETGTYEQTGWGVLDVAPGMKLAAVLERDLPARRIGVLDMATREVVKWIDLDHPVADVAWSPDGTKVLATSYEKDPTIRTHLSADGNSWTQPDDGRTGFNVIDVTSGSASFHPVPRDAKRGPAWSGNPFRWFDDGTLIWEINGMRATANDPQKLFYDLEGRRHDAPEGLLETYTEAGTSPNGALYAGRPALPDRGGEAVRVDVDKLTRELAAAPKGPETAVTDVATGKVVGRQQMLQLRAWADDEHLIALQCVGKCEDEFDSYLVLVTVDGTKSVRLSGAMENFQHPGSWYPLLTRR
ncbi:hypothetical protein GCM10022226_69710 [Sphaerisporangium flaviroseum]|uniref:WD40 repeat domain-containing protein n=1 Tax=Sphaerisporangium flaviroseum TaxID=509199 RepID=A0ABP7J9U2_9ACTN